MVAWILRWVLKVDMMFDNETEGKKFDDDRTQKAQGLFKLFDFTLICADPQSTILGYAAATADLSPVSWRRNSACVM